MEVLCRSKIKACPSTSPLQATYHHDSFWCLSHDELAGDMSIVGSFRKLMKSKVGEHEEYNAVMTFGPLIDCISGVYYLLFSVSWV